MTVVGVPFYNNLGPHWPLTIMACLSVLLTPLPYLFYKWGHLIRRRSRYAHYAEEHGHGPQLEEKEQKQDGNEVARTESRETTAESSSTETGVEWNSEAKEPEIPGVL